MPLSRAETAKTQRFEDGASWIEFRTRLTKHDEDVIADLNSNYRLPPELFGIETGAEAANASVEIKSNIVQTNRTLFDLLAVAWSLGDDKPTATDYDELDSASGRWVDECRIEALRVGRTRAEGKVISSKAPRRSPASSPSAAKSTSKRSPRRSGK